jgi:hypothetical protein
MKSAIPDGAASLDARFPGWRQKAAKAGTSLAAAITKCICITHEVRPPTGTNRELFVVAIFPNGEEVAAKVCDMPGWVSGKDQERIRGELADAKSSMRKMLVEEGAISWSMIRTV